MRFTVSFLVMSFFSCAVEAHCCLVVVIVSVGVAIGVVTCLDFIRADITLATHERWAFLAALIASNPTGGIAGVNSGATCQ